MERLLVQRLRLLVVFAALSVVALGLEPLAVLARQPMWQALFVSHPKEGTARFLSEFVQAAKPITINIVHDGSNFAQAEIMISVACISA